MAGGNDADWVTGSLVVDNRFLIEISLSVVKKRTMSKDNLYHSGLNETDWKILRDVIWPFIHAKDPRKVELLNVPEHLRNHPLTNYIQKYKETGDEKYLDMAGQCLIPTKEPFVWYVPLTK